MNLQIIIIRNNTELIYRLILGPKPRKTINAPRRGALHASCYIKMGAAKLAACQSRRPAVAGPSNPVGVPIAGGVT